MVERTFKIIDVIGIHTRPATKLVGKASQYKSATNIYIQYKEKKVTLKSILGVLGLGVPTGEEFKIIVDGENEEEALASLADIVKNEGLGE